MSIGLYVHIPFCSCKCYYCDFLSMVSKDSTIDSYIDALCKEISYKGRIAGNKGERLHSIYIGGGTPSLLKKHNIERLFNAIYSSFNIEDDNSYPFGKIEITIEANPCSLDSDKISTYKALGINRISIGVQSLRDNELKLMGRKHSSEMAVSAVKKCSELGFENISVDLIYGLPKQGLSDLKISLNNILKLPITHISTYSLIIEEGTKFYRLYHEMDERRYYDESLEGDTLPDEATERLQYWTIIKEAKAKGFNHYEISNLSLPNCQSRHNSSYWECKYYLGVGLGASSYYNSERYTNEKSLKKYLLESQSLCFSKNDVENISDIDKLKEEIVLGLRLKKGININELSLKYKFNFREKYKSIIDKNICDGLLSLEDNILSMTDKGFDLANYCMGDFM